MLEGSVLNTRTIQWEETHTNVNNRIYHNFSFFYNFDEYCKKQLKFLNNNISKNPKYSKEPQVEKETFSKFAGGRTEIYVKCLSMIG